jgi:hypothetical protein
VRWSARALHCISARRASRSPSEGQRYVGPPAPSLHFGPKGQPFAQRRAKPWYVVPPTDYNVFRFSFSARRANRSTIVSFKRSAMPQSLARIWLHITFSTNGRRAYLQNPKDE